MVRFGKIGAFWSIFCFAMALHSSAALAQDDDALLDQYLLEIEELISTNDLEGARNKVTDALTADLRDERLEVVLGQLRLLEALNTTADTPELIEAVSINGALSERDAIAATDLLDSLRIAIENGELAKVRLFTDTTERTDSLLDAVFDNYAAIRVEVTAPEAEEETQSFLATLEFKELTTKEGDTAFPAQAWKQHRLRIIKSDGSWQKILW